MKTVFTEKITTQLTQIPAVYGRVDFSITPVRFTAQPGDQTELHPEFAHLRPELLADKERVALIRSYTLIGDVVADAYAALIPQYGFEGLVKMLEQACDRGLESVPSAPPELVRFIQAMEQLPPWLDRKLIEEGARLERNGYAHKVPFALRGGFIATFMNKYSALPMILTGALSHKSAGRRVRETGTFYISMVMPDVLDRRSVAFKSAGMVRLMHSMVRFNLLDGGDRWDPTTYGVPIPQVDQLPAGLLSAGLLAQNAFRRGRTAFTPSERARVELGRYRCFLLGLPQALLPDTPRDIATILLTRHATLRKGFDDTCIDLVRATMDADLTTDRSLPDRLHERIERGFARVCFVPKFLRAGKNSASGVHVGLADYVAAAAAVILIAVRMTAYGSAAFIPGIRRAADRSLVRKLNRQLTRYGHAEFKTNAATYGSAHAG